MMRKKLLSVLMLVMAIAPGARLAAQVQTEVPSVVPGAKPVSVERIKIHGASLEGNLEGNAVDRDAPLAFIDQYVADLRRYRGIALDVGDQDGLRTDTGKLHDVLDEYGIGNSFEIYPGTHTSAVAIRFQNHVLPFFSRNLSFEIGRVHRAPRT